MQQATVEGNFYESGVVSPSHTVAARKRRRHRRGRGGGDCGGGSVVIVLAAAAVAAAMATGAPRLPLLRQCSAAAVAETPSIGGNN
jgi:hypothetical protein